MGGKETARRDVLEAGRLDLLHIIEDIQHEKVVPRKKERIVQQVHKLCGIVAEKISQQPNPRSLTTEHTTSGEHRCLRGTLLCFQSWVAKDNTNSHPRRPRTPARGVDPGKPYNVPTTLELGWLKRSAKPSIWTNITATFEQRCAHWTCPTARKRVTM